MRAAYYNDVDDTFFLLVTVIELCLTDKIVHFQSLEHLQINYYLNYLIFTYTHPNLIILTSGIVPQRAALPNCSVY